MTTTSTPRKAGPFTGNGVTTVFPFSFKLFAQADVKVTEVVLSTGVETVKALSTDYLVSLNADQDAHPGGYITALVPPASTVAWVISSNMSEDQQINFANLGGFYPTVLNQGLDKLTILVQQLREVVSRAIVVPISSIASTLTPAPQANTFLGWNSTANAIINYAGIASAAVSSFMSSVVGAASSLAAKVLLGVYAVSLADYGTLGIGNDAAVFQAAVNAVQGTSVGIEIPPNTTVQLGGTTINITDTIRVRGAHGRSRCAISWTGTTMYAISVATDKQVHFEGLTFAGPGACTNGGAIKLDGSGGVSNSFSTFRDIVFSNGYVQIFTESAYAWHIDNCYFSGFVSLGINVKNTLFPDAGDSHVSHCTFSNAATAAACISHASSGGLRVLSNKFNTAQYSYRMQLEASTSDLVFAANSCENFSVAAMGFFRTAGTFNNITITGNQMALGPSGILMNDPASFFSTATITGNVMTALTSTGISVHNASDITISGNTITGTGGATVVGLLLSAGVTNPCIGPNKIKNFTTPVSNLSTSGAVTGFTRPLGLLATGSAAPNDLTEDILFTIKVPAGCMGLTGFVRLYLAWAHANNANGKTLRARLGGIGGTVIWTQAAANASQTRAQIMVGNTGAANSQLATSIGQLDATLQNPATIAAAIDTSVDQTIVVTSQKATVAGDSIVLQNAVAELLGTF